MNDDKIKRLEAQLQEAKDQRDKFSSGSIRHNDWTREVQRIANVIAKLRS